MIANFVKKKGIEEVDIRNDIVIVLLLYANYVMFLVNTLGDAQKLMRSLKEFCIMHIKLSVNSSKMNIMLVKS